MPTLEELLRESLKGTSAKFEAARTDLNAAVLELRKGVEAVSDGRVTVALEEREIDAAGTRFARCVYEKGTRYEGQSVALYLLRSTGYPTARVDSATGFPHEEFQSADALAADIRKLAADPDSLLVAYLAYFLRQPARSAG